MRPASAHFVLIVAACWLQCQSEAGIALRRKHRPDYLPSAPVAGQRGELIELGDGVAYYFGLHQNLNFRDSQEQCDNMNMTLANIETQEKYEMFLDFLLENPFYDYWMWVSGRRLADTSAWLWGSGQPLTYTAWSPGQPDVEQSLEACANFAGYHGTWEDDECELWQMSYLCEPKPEA